MTLNLAPKVRTKFSRNWKGYLKINLILLALGLQFDQLALDVYDNTVTYFISIYGKTKAEYELYAELIVGESEEKQAASEPAEGK